MFYNKLVIWALCHIHVYYCVSECSNNAVCVVLAWARPLYEVQYPSWLNTCFDCKPLIVFWLPASLVRLNASWFRRQSFLADLFATNGLTIPLSLFLLFSLFFLQYFLWIGSVSGSYERLGFYTTGWINEHFVRGKIHPAPPPRSMYTGHGSKRIPKTSLTTGAINLNCFRQTFWKKILNI